MNLTFKPGKFYINEDGENPISVLCEVDLVMTEPPDPGTPPSLNHPGDPPWPAEFEIHEVRLIADVTGFTQEPVTQTLILSESDFCTFFSQGQDVCNNAYEWASEQEIEHDYD